MNRNLGRIAAAALVIVLLVGAYMTWRVVDNTATALDQLGADTPSTADVAADEPMVETPVARKGRKARRRRKARLAEGSEPESPAPRLGRVPPEMLGGRALEAPVIRRPTSIQEALRGQALRPDPDAAPPLVGEGAIISTELSGPNAPEAVDTGAP